MRQEILDKLYQMFENELEHHPSSRLIDLFKLYMQSAFGPGHLIKDTDSARAYLYNELVSYKQYISKFSKDSKNAYFNRLKDEYKLIPPPSPPTHSSWGGQNESPPASTEASSGTTRGGQNEYPPPTPPINVGGMSSPQAQRQALALRGGYIYITCPCLILDCDIWHPLARFSLQFIAEGIIPFEDYFEAFIETAKDVSEKTINYGEHEEKIYQKYWDILLPFFAEKNIDGFEVDRAIVENHFFERQYLVRHSMIYNTEYKPSYRIINKQFLRQYETIYNL